MAQRQMSRERSNSLLEQQAQQAAAAGESRHQQLQAVSEQQQQEQQGAASRDGGGGASAGGGGGGGLFGGLKTKLAKMIPTGNEMKLPDDSKKSVRRYVLLILSVLLLTPSYSLRMLLTPHLTGRPCCSPLAPPQSLFLLANPLSTCS